MSSELMNVTAPALSFVGCNNATQKVCAAISGTASYVTDFATKFNQTCGPFMPTNATLVLTVSAAMDGISVLVGGPANVAGGASTYLKAGLTVAYCGHETLKAMVPTYDTASALIGAGATVGAGFAVAIAACGLLRCRRVLKNRAAGRSSVYAQPQVYQGDAGSDGENDALVPRSDYSRITK